ncbi:MAG: TIGR03667 family PPOX class F420-dependent oxidoreductase [Chloroflexota bacterium]|nr:TIGR03667 family PPOX class F420-dependent oxidoreductase [Chloroflexota bacterium]
MQIDTTTDFGKRVERRLREEQIIWLTTAGQDGTPQPSPVWFLWEGETALIFSKPNTPKMRNIARNAKVSLHFDGDGRGGNIVVLTGEARIVEPTPTVAEIPAYVTKYAEGIKRIGSTPEQMIKEYSQALRITLTNVRGH